MSSKESKEPLPLDRCMECGAKLENGAQDLCSRCDRCAGEACKVMGSSNVDLSMDGCKATVHFRPITVRADP